MLPARAHALNAKLETSRLTLEPLTAHHAEALFGPMQDERIYRWISSVPPGTVEGLRHRWAAVEARLSPAGDGAWLAWAVRLAGDGRYVGKVDAEVDADEVATNVGYFFFPPFWGHGYAAETIRAVVAHFDGHRISEARATVTVGHDASARVLAKAGFVAGRLLKSADSIRGVACDDVEYVRRPQGIHPI